MDNVYETIDEARVHEEPRDGAKSPDRDPKYESPAKATEPLYSEVQVHVSTKGEGRSSPDYMAVRDEHKHSSSSSSSSDNEEEAKAEEAKAEAEVKEEAKSEEGPVVCVMPEPAVCVTPEPAVCVMPEPELCDLPEPVVCIMPEPEFTVKVEEVNGGSRRSSASSASSASPGDPCDDPPIQPRVEEEETAENCRSDSPPSRDTTPEQSVDLSVQTLESVTLDDSSAAPEDPSQPEISLFVKVRLVYRPTGEQRARRYLIDCTVII
ncbi:hypothetical protein PBY51_007028 [Eleginops maclovinus]|uniref:Uncharacterized protein n=1 Tax=Eleginops maclovinus TaxID=56733 RepID=A0AAN7X267_ELEMC|nr:hypothetical protein PBY51_007028 [Eleginops maclovinus]